MEAKHAPHGREPGDILTTNDRGTADLLWYGLTTLFQLSTF
jgi:hypothetical protein